MNVLPLTTALIMGFLGSLHCAGMCGPIMLVMPFQSLNGWMKWAGIGLYHFGRISVYACIGLLLYSFKSLFQPQWQQYVSIGLGLLLLFMGAYSFLAKGIRLFPASWLNYGSNLAAKFMGNPKLWPLLLTGMLNGILPCGIVYMALSLTASANSPGEAIAIMYAFGIGTLPMLIGIILLKKRIGIFGKRSIYRFAPLLLLAFGGLFFLRGLNLGVPYLSPRVEAVGGKIESSCCHPR